jgi:hypothetical protein
MAETEWTTERVWEISKFMNVCIRDICFGREGSIEVTEGCYISL